MNQTSPIFPLDNEPVGIYIHIPFCKTRCHYCGFVSNAHDTAREEEYVGLVIREMEIRAAASESAGLDRGRTVDTIYLGGGTPSLLTPDLITQLMDACAANFHVSSQPEITMEINPASASRSDMRGFLQAGVNRVSLGIQSWDDDELRLMGRPHDVAEALRAFEDLRDAGFDNISMDLIAGYPRQTRDGIRASVQRTLALEPEHLSIYLLEPKHGTRLAAQLQCQQLSVDDDLAADMYEDICRMASEAGFQQYEISNFATRGRVSRHNMKYWTDTVFIGLGSGAHGMTGRNRYSNFSDLAQYEKAVKQGLLPHETFIDLTPMARFKDALIMGLRLVDGVDLGLFEDRYRIDALAFVKDTVGDLQDAGLLVFSERNVALTDRGRLLSNVVFSRWV